MKKKWLLGVVAMLSVLMLVSGCASSKTEGKAQANDGKMLVYGSHDYTRINPAIDEHGEINTLIFNGLTAHDENGDVVPCLAEKWDLDDQNNTYTFHLEKGVTWHDGKPFTAKDVKFTIEAIQNPDNESEIASNYEDVESIKVIDPETITFKLKEKNVAFLEYMTIGILPEHLLKGEDMQTSAYFKNPVGTGPYKMKKWEVGQSIKLVKNENYFKKPAKIDTILFKIVEDDNAKALQLKSGELDLAMVTPKDAKNFAKNKEYQVYDMTTSDYRGILYNFNNKFWQKNKEIIPALNYAIDRQAIVDTVLLGQGEIAYGPLQRNKYNYEDVEKYEYNPTRTKELLEEHGWKKDSDGIFAKDGQKLHFTIDSMEGDQVRADVGSLAAQQLRKIGVDAKAEVKTNVDWDNQEANLIGWGSPFDADDHTYKVFGTNKGSNYSAYSNKEVDKALIAARQTDDETKRQIAYADFQKSLADDPAYTFICYVDVNYVANKNLKGITTDTVLGHHGVGIFWNITDWSL